VNYPGWYYKVKNGTAWSIGHSLELYKTQHATAYDANIRTPVSVKSLDGYEIIELTEEQVFLELL